MNAELYLKAYFDGFVDAFKLASELLNAEQKAADTPNDKALAASDAELAAQIQRIKRRGLI